MCLESLVQALMQCLSLESLVCFVSPINHPFGNKQLILLIFQLSSTSGTTRYPFLTLI